MPDSSPNAPLILYIAHKDDPIEYDGTPKISITGDGGARLSFDHRGYLIPWAQTDRAKVVAKINGNDWFNGNVVARSSKEYGSPGGPLFSYTVNGYYDHLHRNPINIIADGTIAGILDLLAEKSGAADFIRSIVFRTGEIYDQQLLDFVPIKEIKRKNIPIYGKFFDEAISLILGDLARWYFHPGTRDLVIYNKEQLIKRPALNLATIQNGCGADWQIVDIDFNYDESNISRVIAAKDAESLKYQGNTVNRVIKSVIPLFGVDTQQFPLKDKTNKLISFRLQGEAVAGGCSVSDPVISGDFYIYIDYAIRGNGLQNIKPGHSYSNYDFSVSFDVSPISLKYNYQIDGVKESTRVGFYIHSYVSLYTYTANIKCNNNLLYSFTSPIASDPFEPTPQTYSLITSLDLLDYIGQSVDIEIEVIGEVPPGPSPSALINNFLADATCCSLKRFAGSGSNDDFITPITDGTSPGDGFDAKDANLYYAGQSVVLSDGTLIIAQYLGYPFGPLNQVIRKVDPVTNIITTIAGLYGDPYSHPVNSLPFYRPNFGEDAFAQAIRCVALAKDNSDNIYFLDDYSLYIGKINRNNILTMLFDLKELYESWASDFNLPIGATITIVNDNLYLTDPESCTVIKINLSKGNGVLIAGIPPSGTGGSYTKYTDNPSENATANTSSIGFPKCTTEDSQGNIYILTARYIKKVDLDGKITTFAGGSPFVEPYAFTTKVHVFGNKDQIIIGQEYEVEFEFSYNNSPMYIFCDNADNLYFSDNHQPIVRKLNIQTGIVEPYIGNLNVVETDGGIFHPVQSPIVLGQCPLKLQLTYWPFNYFGCPFYMDNFTDMAGLTLISNNVGFDPFGREASYFLVLKGVCE